MRSKGVRRGIQKVAQLDIGNIFGAEQNDSLTFKIPSSRVAFNRQLLKQVQQMKQAAARHHMLYLTANQVESLHRVFLVNRLHYLSALTHPQYCNPSDYQAYINPTIVSTKGEPIEVEEQCLVIPFIIFKVHRFPEINLEYRDEHRDYLVQTLTGNIAHMAQHCINHLDGKLLLEYELSRGRFYVQKDIAISFPKTSFLLKEYSLRLKAHHDKIAKGQAKIDDEQFVKMKDDYVGRLKEEYDKENRAFSMKIQQKTGNST